MGDLLGVPLNRRCVLPCRSSGYQRQAKERRGCGPPVSQVGGRNAAMPSRVPLSRMPTVKVTSARRNFDGAGFRDGSGCFVWDLYLSAPSLRHVNMTRNRVP